MGSVGARAPCLQGPPRRHKQLLPLSPELLNGPSFSEVTPFAIFDRGYAVRAVAITVGGVEPVSSTIGTVTDVQVRLWIPYFICNALMH